MSKRRSGQQNEVSATELAQMGFCEKQVLLNHLYGKRTTSEQRDSMARGQAAHQQYLDEGMTSTADRRCFVASCVFGPEAVETQVLRAYRDAVLSRQCWGRWAVAVYYRISPTVCRILERSPIAAAGVRGLLRIVVNRCRKTIDGRGRT